MRRLLPLILLASACAGPPPEDRPDPDAGVPTDGGNPIFEPSPIAEPEPPRMDRPAPPVMTPCPSGWREVPPTETGFPSAVCEPFPEGSGVICGDDEAHFPGTPGCARIGTECPAGDPWPADLPTDRTVVFVRPGAAGGNGTRGAPYGSITAAIAATGDGAVIALAAGTYDEALVIDKAVTLLGACVRDTRLSDSSYTGTVRVTSPGAALENLHLEGTDLGVMVEAAGELSMVNVVVQDAAGGGVVLMGGMLTADSLVIRETGDGTYFGRGLVAVDGARVTASHVELFGNQDIAVDAEGATTEVALSDVTIRDTSGSPKSAQYGLGVLASEGAQVALVRAGLERNRDRALWAYNGTISAVDTVIRDTRPSSADRTDGIGGQAQGGGTLSLSRTWIEHSRTIGVYLSEDGASAQLEDVIVNRTDPQASDDTGGRGVNAQLGVELTMTRVLVKESHEMGVFVAADSHAVLTDVSIEDTHNVGILGTGLTFNFGARAEIARLRVARATQGGIAIGDGSMVTMTDAVVEDTLGLDADGSEGLALVLQSGSSLTASRVRIERCLDQGVFLRDPGTTAVFDNLIVQDVKSGLPDGRFGRGFAVEVGASGEINRGLFERTHEHALIANGSAAAIRAEDLTVRDTMARDSDGFSGRGLAVQLEASAVITRARFSDSVEVGVFVSGEAATATLTDVVIERTESRSDGVGGRGLDISEGGHVVARGLLLADNREFGMVAVDPGSRADLFDAIVTGTRENGCPTDECLGFGKGGTGIGSAKSAAVHVSHFLVEKSALAGLALTHEGTIDLIDGEVAFNPVGVNVDADGYNLDRLRDQVRYHDNDLTLQAISVPEPRASDIIAGALSRIVRSSVSRRSGIRCSWRRIALAEACRDHCDGEVEAKFGARSIARWQRHPKGATARTSATRKSERNGFRTGSKSPIAPDPGDRRPPARAVDRRVRSHPARRTSPSGPDRPPRWSRRA